MSRIAKCSVLGLFLSGMLSACVMDLDLDEDDDEIAEADEEEYGEVEQAGTVGQVTGGHGGTLGGFFSSVRNSFNYLSGQSYYTVTGDHIRGGYVAVGTVNGYQRAYRVFPNGSVRSVTLSSQNYPRIKSPSQMNAGLAEKFRRQGVRFDNASPANPNGLAHVHGPKGRNGKSTFVMNVDGTPSHNSKTSTPIPKELKNYMKSGGWGSRGGGGWVDNDIVSPPPIKSIQPR